ncbi:MAG: dephospho-CoA kinase [Deltaproteobacteria bacterium RIFOXYD12_FULL_50_9]|nr:MAG: dephospho-CoA kinase [Deltaproteobacteria bacterium RIFOXYD12_FULL_50_9]
MVKKLYRIKALTSHTPGRNIIGLTGGMGSGKTSVAAYLQTSLAIKFINADIVSRNLLLPESQGWKALYATFGNRYFTGNNFVDTLRLRKDIFTDSDIRQRINILLHPIIKEAIFSEISESVAAGISVIIVEVPLLFEAGWQDDFDAVVTVYANQAVCLARLMARDRCTKSEAQMMIDVQFPSAAKALLADHVIDNSGPWAATYWQLLRLSKIIAGSFS